MAFCGIAHDSNMKEICLVQDNAIIGCTAYKHVALLREEQHIKGGRMHRERLVSGINENHF